MDVRQLRYFVACVEEGSILGAAQRLRVAQPALSRQIKDLEQDLGCQLFERVPRGVRMTKAGGSLYRDAVAILASFEQAAARAARIGADQDREIGFGAVRTCSRFAFLNRGLVDFRATHPEIDVVVSCSSSRDLISEMTRNRLDMAVLYQKHPDGERFEERSIHHESYVVALHPSHRLAQQPELRLTDLAGEALVWLSRANNPDNHDRLLQQCRANGLDPLIGYQADTQDEQLELLSICGGICLTPASTRLVVTPGRLVFREISNCTIELQLRLVWRRDLTDLPVVQLLGCLNAAIDAHQADIREGESEWAVAPGGTRLARCD